MTTAFAARASRQTVSLTAIAGLHLGAFVLIASGLGPTDLGFDAPDPPIKLILREADPIQSVRPGKTAPIEDYFLVVPKPDDSLVPQIDGAPAAPFARDDRQSPIAGGGTAAPLQPKRSCRLCSG